MCKGAEAGVCLVCLKTLVQLESWEGRGVCHEMISYKSISAGLESPVPPSGGEGVTGFLPKTCPWPRTISLLSEASYLALCPPHPLPQAGTLRPFQGFGAL